MTGKTRKAGRDAGVGGRLTAALAGQAGKLAAAAGNRALSTVNDWAGAATERLTDYAENGGGPGLAAAVAGAKQVAAGKSPTSAALHAGMAGVKERIGRALGGKGKQGKRNKLKVTNIVETIDVGVPARVAYNQWTQFEDFPNFTKKVEHVERTGDDKLTWKAQVFWSHRSWESTVVEQVPDRRVVWRSTGEKGSVDGSVTFHELAPELTRILLVLEYHPQGLFERTGNIWRAQGRRARLELKHFARHVAVQTALHQDEVEGWRGEIRDGRVVHGHEPEASPQRRSPDRSDRSDAGEASESPTRERETAGGSTSRRTGSGSTQRTGSESASRTGSGSTRQTGSGPTRETGSGSARRTGSAPARRTAATRDSTTRDSTTRDSTTRDSTTRDSTTRDSAARDSETRDREARDSATQGREGGRGQ
nr:SRPBCC family protein [Rugosimonospora africana]